MDFKVSIVMPSYNSLATIKDSIDSIIKQSYSNWELLITDDCSTDGTQDYLHEMVNKDPRIKVFYNSTNLGAGASRNSSIAAAEGRFIAFLDSDDSWHKDKLLRQIAFMIQNSYPLTYTWYRKVDQFGTPGGLVCSPKNVSHSQLLKSNVIGCLTAIYDTKILGKVFMPTIRKRQDMALWLNILQRVDYAWCLEEELAYYREGVNTLSSNKLKVLFSQWGFYRDYLKFDLLRSVYYFSFYIFKALKKHHLSK